MPSLNLRNPLRRDPNRPTLKQRAAALKATAGRLIRKPKPLPAAGSREALAAFGAACRAVDHAGLAVEGERDALKIGTGLQYWTSDVIQQAQMGNFSHVMPQDVEAAKATPKARLEELLILALRRELRMAEAAHSSRIRELHALVYGDEPDPADEDDAPAADEPAIAQAIEAHRAAQTAFSAASWAHDREHVRRTGGDTSDEAMAAAQAAWEAADAAETQAWTRLLKARPASAAGLLQMLRYIGSATTALESVTSPCEFARDIAEATETALARDAGEEVDWHNPPPGFMAFPAIEPMSFINIRIGIVAELERLRGIARAEYARREPFFQESFTQAELEGRLSALHDELRLSALDAAIADHKTARAADAELIALGRAFDAATVRDRETNDALNAAEDRAEPRLPERPAALIYREGDNLFPLREYGDAFAGIAVTPSDIEWMTRRPAQREVWVDDPAAQPGWSMVPGKKPRIVHWPEAQARIDEIVAAWDAWHAEQDRVLDEAGVTEARDATADTSDAAAALARQIAAQPAHTAEGMRVKLRVAAFYCVCDPDTPEGEGYPGEAAIRSLYRDTPGIEISTDPSDVRIVPEA